MTNNTVDNTEMVLNRPVNMLLAANDRGNLITYVTRSDGSVKSFSPSKVLFTRTQPLGVQIPSFSFTTRIPTGKKTLIDGKGKTVNYVYSWDCRVLTAEDSNTFTVQGRIKSDYPALNYDIDTFDPNLSRYHRPSHWAVTFSPDTYGESYIPSMFEINRATVPLSECFLSQSDFESLMKRSLGSLAKCPVFQMMESGKVSIALTAATFAVALEHIASRHDNKGNPIPKGQAKGVKPLELGGNVAASLAGLVYSVASESDINRAYTPEQLLTQRLTIDWSIVAHAQTMGTLGSARDTPSLPDLEATF